VGIRERIITACRDLSQVRGFHGVTIDELAARAGVSKRTIYRYFASKDEIIAATVDEFLVEMDRYVNEVIQTGMNPADMLTAIIRRLQENGRFITASPGFSDLQVRYPHLWKRIDDFRMGKVRFMLEVIRQRSNSPLIRETNPQIMSAIILTVVQSVLTPDFIIRNGLTFEETVNQVSRFFLAIMSQER